MSDEKAKDAAEKETMEFRFLKGNSFHAVHVDGAWGGVTPRGDIHMVVYSERPAIPDKVIHEIIAGHFLGGQVGEEGAGGLVREAEVDLIMSLQTAKGMAVWLQDKITKLESVINEQINHLVSPEQKQK
jgi:hypothetical protein